jgi:hypothetical protein
MKREDMQFTIDQLRKDKIIYAVEACAVSMACLLGILASNFLPLPSGLYENLPIILMGIGIAYTVYMGVSNFRRLQRIRDLEKKLKLDISMIL